MKVYPQSVHDQLTGKEIWFGVDLEEGRGPAYDKAMKFLNDNQGYQGGERYEYFGNGMEIQFMWDMTNDEFKALMVHGKDSEGLDLSDYLGAVFFGNFKLEFIWNDVAGAFNNLFWYGQEDRPGYAYAYLEDGTPYEELDPPFVIPKRRTFEAFAKNVEAQVTRLLNMDPTYIEEALKPTDPTKWYPDGQCNVTRDITRVS